MVIRGRLSDWDTDEDDHLRKKNHAGGEDETGHEKAGATTSLRPTTITTVYYHNCRLIGLNLRESRVSYNQQ